MSSFRISYPVTRSVAYAIAPASLGGSLSGIRLSNASFTAGAAQGTLIGEFSVIGGSGFYTFTLTDASGQTQSDFQYLEVGATPATAGSFSISVNADNGAGSVFDRTFLITAVDAFSPSLQFNDGRNAVLTAII